MILEIDRVRMAVSGTTDSKRKTDLGQYLTPSSIAHFMASLFQRNMLQECHLLDAGAGIGTLSSAFLNRCRSGELQFKRTIVDTFEIDDRLQPYLKATLEEFVGPLQLSLNSYESDFIEAAANALAGEMFHVSLPRYTHAILNPPYKKIRSNSAHRAMLRRAGIETVNLYSAFVALALSLLVKEGQLVAIIPRSFCNGPYYKPFRAYLLKRAAITHIHLFHARDKAFKNDSVLQENVIIALECGRAQGAVTVSVSTDDSFADFSSRQYAFDQIVFPNDTEFFIHIPTDSKQESSNHAARLTTTLSELGLEVSTGPLVDFRVRQHTRLMPELGTVPLLYPGHFAGATISWPKTGFRKPNAILKNAETAKSLFPNGFYTVVRRFSTKEERRRIVASVVDPSHFNGAAFIGFENHLNVYHSGKKGISEDLARGLAAFLNTGDLDSYFRGFNGHTQVNATDLRQIRYPTRSALICLGQWLRISTGMNQARVDEKVKEIIG